MAYSDDYNLVKVADNCIHYLQVAAALRATPVYLLFRDIEGWSYDKAAYYFRRDPSKINQDFLDMMTSNFDCTLDDLFEGAEKRRK